MPRARRRGPGDTPVGSVVVLDGAILGEGIEALPAGDSITGHAETLACRAALDATGRRDLAGAIVYTAAEPCSPCGSGKETPVIGAVTSIHPIPIDPRSSAGARPRP
ncbi:Guanine deaminase [Aquisphaera giovannonii]|uniref:Guanine deaminase n=1 Tax=Aquisphaera giovannonii TaxID=406548 RepID=A0A5B9VWS0_9BACT|nr:deaminase [Aquisphaera giovannonii]QEH32225.1 Guanine deaminase [Aquisphaera giovannonii]